MFNRFVLLLIWFRLNVLKSKRLQTREVDPSNYRIELQAPQTNTVESLHLSAIFSISNQGSRSRARKKLSLAIDKPWVYLKVTVTWTSKE